ncbi:MAG: energy-coupling factor transporter ATPase [Actinobacteria bacterium]|nr:energy-coupling factor transporter ATPase [Actinomycetota bacterium]
MIEFSGVKFWYGERHSERLALAGMDLRVEEGEFVAFVGPNGSGKSTLARHINGLLSAKEGRVEVDGLNPADPSDVWKVRELVGMVFQNPDNQIVATIVEEDIAFGPENLGLPGDEIRRRVDQALASVRMERYARSEPHLLSGGQKQRVAIAGTLAMRPKYLLLDEPTSMLDPAGRREVRETLDHLNKTEGVTVLLITHFVDEAVMADRTVVLVDGRITLDGPPREVFDDLDVLKKIGLDAPLPRLLAGDLAEAGVISDRPILTIDDLVEACLNQKLETRD